MEMIGVSREKLRGLELMLPLSSSTPLERPHRPVGDSWYAPEVFEQSLQTPDAIALCFLLQST